FPVATPYGGDYFDLQAVGDTFFGTFSASNNLNDVLAPLGVQFQRNFDYLGPETAPFRLRNVTDTQNVGFSIDPYFFSVPVTPGASPVPGPGAARLAAVGSLLLLWWLRRRRAADRIGPGA